MEKEFVPYNFALRMKQLGFDEPCFARFNNDGDLLIAHTEKYIIDNGVDRSEFFTLAPLYQQAFRWFRQEYGLHHVIHQLNFKKGTDEEYLAEVDKKDGFSYFRTYEECEYYCLEKLLEIVEGVGS